jgi:predicted thioesterase
MPHYRPYQVVPGHPITIVIESVDGGRVEVTGRVVKITDVATPNTVLRMRVEDARFRPLPAR